MEKTLNERFMYSITPSFSLLWQNLTRQGRLILLIGFFSAALILLSAGILTVFFWNASTTAQTTVTQQNAILERQNELIKIQNQTLTIIATELSTSRTEIREVKTELQDLKTAAATNRANIRDIKNKLER